MYFVICAKSVRMVDFPSPIVCLQNVRAQDEQQHYRPCDRTLGPLGIVCCCGLSTFLWWFFYFHRNSLFYGCRGLLWGITCDYFCLFCFVSFAFCYCCCWCCICLYLFPVCAIQCTHSTSIICWNGTSYVKPKNVIVSFRGFQFTPIKCSRCYMFHINF